MDNQSIHQEAARILTDPDFQEYRQLDNTPNLMKMLRDWLHSLNWHFGDFSGGSMAWQIAGLVFKLLILAAIVCAVVILIRIAYQKFCEMVQPQQGLIRISQAERQEQQEKYAQLAAAALERQDYRQAVHYLLMAAVSRVIRDSLFQGSESLTNREIAGSTDFSYFAEPGRLGDLFDEMVFFDEPRWFGNQAIGSSEYETFRSMYVQFTAGLKARSGGRHA